MATRNKLNDEHKLLEELIDAIWTQARLYSDWSTHHASPEHDRAYERAQLRVESIKRNLWQSMCWQEEQKHEPTT